MNRIVLVVLLLLFGSVATGLEEIVASISKVSDFVYPLESNTNKGNYIEIYAHLPLRMHESNDGHEICCILEQSEEVELMDYIISQSYLNSPFTFSSFDYNLTYNDTNSSDSSDSDSCLSSEMATTEEIWVPLKTIFCNPLYYNGKQEIFKSLNVKGIERWNESMKHRLHFTTGCYEVVGVPITIRQSHISGSTQEIISMVLLLLACITLCVDKACRSNVLFVYCLASFIFLGLCGKFPSSATVFSWIDAGTIFIKMSSNLFISSLNGTGIHEYIAYKLLYSSRGRPRYLALSLWIFTGIVAIFIPGMATVYFATKITLIACKEMKINPIPIIFGQMVMINVGSVGSTVDPAMLIIIKYFDIPPYQTLYLPLVYALVCGLVVACALTLFYSRELSEKSVLTFKKISSPPSGSSSPYLAPESDLSLTADSTLSTPRFSQRYSHVSIPAIELTSLSSTETRKRSRHWSSKMPDSPGMGVDLDSNDNTIHNTSDSCSSLPSSHQGSPVFSPTYPMPIHGAIGSPSEIRGYNVSTSSDTNSPKFSGLGSPMLSSSSMDTECFTKSSDFKNVKKTRVFWVLGIVIALNAYSLIFTLVGLDFCLFMVFLTSIYIIYLWHKKEEIIHEFFPLENLLLIALSFVFVGSLDSLGLSRMTSSVINRSLEKLPVNNFEIRAAMIILSLSCFGSAFIDNPVWALIGSKILDSCLIKYDLNKTVLTMALAYGIYSGGLSTIFGSMPNIAAAELCNYYNFKLNFVEYSKVAIPMCILVLGISCIFINLYFFMY